MISVSFDVDWAPDAILIDCLNLLSRANVKATFFATHQTPVLSKDSNLEHEVGIHPNFMPNFHGKGRHYHEVLDEIMSWYPNARGVRFHSLGLAAPILDYCFSRGICYDSSVYVPQQIEPFDEYVGIYRIPFQCSDLQMVIDKEDFKIDLEKYYSNLPLVVLLHPIHIFLNTYSLEHYSAAKKYYHDVNELKNHVNTRFPGIRDFFIDILSKENQYNFITLEQLYDRYKKDN